MIISLTVQRVVEDDHRGETGCHRYRLDQDEVLVGRDAATDVRLPHPAVSLVHLRLLRKDGRLWAVDGGSTNGTLVDGRRLEPGSGLVVGDGSRLRLGPFEIAIGPHEAAQEVNLTSRGDTARLARQMVLEVIGSGGCDDERQPALEVLDGPERGTRLHLPPLGAPRVVGRGEECALRLSDADASRRHFEVQNKGEVVELRDLGSKNGVKLNGLRVEGVVALSHGDELGVGLTRLRFVDPAEALLRQLGTAEEMQLSTDGADSVDRMDAASRRGLTAGGGIAVRDGPAVRTRIGSLLLMVVVGGVVLAALAGVVWLLL